MENQLNEKQKEKLDKKQNRTGLTVITSASVSKEFDTLIKRYHLSPTECFRRGVAITLCDLGITPYDNPINQQRLKEATEFLKEIDEIILLKEKLRQVERILKELNNFV